MRGREEGAARRERTLIRNQRKRKRYRVGGGG